MAASTLVDAGFLVALLHRGDAHHGWATGEAARYPPPWMTCEAVLTEAFHLVGPAGRASLAALVARGAVTVGFALGPEFGPVLKLLEKYADVPMSLADACLVRLTETTPDPVLLTADGDFHIYRRHGRQAIPTAMPARR